MNYPLSEKILGEIKKAKKILVNCHRSPDADSVGSALALYEVLLSLGKEVRVICPDHLSEKLRFLPHSDKFETIDFTKFDFAPYGLFIILDSSSPLMVTDGKEIPLPKMKKIVIDHHRTNELFAETNLIDENISSTSEILYLLFEDWGTPLTKDISQNLLAGILTDTGIFQYPNVTSQTIKVAQKLMDNGAEKGEIILNTFRSYSFDEVRLWGEILKRMEFDKEHKFVWSAIPSEILEEYSRPENAGSNAATIFAPVVDGSDFGIVIVEREKGILSVNLRGRTGFDVSKVALKLGGGGHQGAAGARVQEKNFDQAVLKVLEVTRKVVSENKN